MRRHALFWPPVVYHGLLLTLLRQKPTLFLPLRLGLHHGISVWTGHQTSQTISSSTVPDALVPVPPSVKTKEGKKRVWFGSATQDIITRVEQFLTPALGHQGPPRSAFLRAP